MSPSAPNDTALLLEEIPVGHLRHAGQSRFKQALAWAVTIALTSYAFYGFAVNPAVDWAVITEYVFSPLILQGVLITIVITCGAVAIGLSGGLLLALARLRRQGPLKQLAIGYINLFRAVPLLVQILIWYNLGTFLPEIGIGIPFTDLGFYAPTNDVLTPIAACLIAFGLNQAAYMGEIIRGGLLSVQAGQVEAGIALGMTRGKVFRRVTLPQAARSIIPALGNDIISLLKGTALVSVVGVGDLMTRTQSIYATTYQVIPMLLVASLWYIVLTFLLSLLQSWAERHFAAGSTSPQAQQN